MKSRSGFTIVEIIIVVVVIGILVAISSFSFIAVREQAPDSQRDTDVVLISEALEKYFEKNGEYPSCMMMTASPTTVASSTLQGINTENLRAPMAPSTVRNSISCVDIGAGSDDVYAYLGDGTAACATGASCSGFLLRYKREDGTIKEVRSRNNSNIAGVETPGYCESEWTVFVYDMNMAGCGTTVQLPIATPASASGYTIDWGDDTTGTLSSLTAHTYGAKGTYYARYNGPIDIIDGETIPSNNASCLKEVRQWGSRAAPTRISHLGGSNFAYVAEPPSSLTSMNYIYRHASSFNQPLNGWSTGNVTAMTGMFSSATSFNQPLNNWNTSKVVNMDTMFTGAESFNQNLSSWNVTLVTPKPPLEFRVGAAAWTLAKPGTGW